METRGETYLDVIIQNLNLSEPTKSNNTVTKDQQKLKFMSWCVDIYNQWNMIIFTNPSKVVGIVAFMLKALFKKCSHSMKQNVFYFF